MKELFNRFITVILTLAILTCILPACSKKSGSETKQSSQNTAKSSTNTAKASEKATTKANSQSKTQADTSTNKLSSVTNAAGEKSNIGSGNENISDNIVQENQNSNSSDIFNEDFALDVTLEQKLGEKSFDLGGKTIVMAGPSQPALPTNDPSTGVLYIIYKKLEAAEKKYNFKMEYKVVPSSTHYAEIANQTMAGIKYADIVSAQSQHCFPIYATNGIILPWDDYVDYENPILKVNSYLYYGTMWNGKHYGTSRGTYEASYPELMYNRSILEREGQPDILDLVEAKQWNWEAMLNIAKNCTRDVDGNGVIDQWGIVSKSANYLAINMLHSNGTTLVALNDGEPIVNLYSSEARRALQFISDLAFVHGVFTIEKNAIPYKNGLAAITLNSGWSENTEMLKLGLQSICSPLPMGPDVNEYQNIAGTNLWVMLSTCETPREVAVIMAEASITWDENLNPIPELEELNKATPYDWTWNSANTSRRISTEREYILSVKALIPNFKPDYVSGFTNPNLTASLGKLIFDPIMKGEKSVDQALAAAENELNAVLDKYK